MTNKEIAHFFDILSKLIDIHGDDSFKAKSYASAAFRIDKFPQPLSELDINTLKTLPGIGASLALKIEEINTTGELRALNEYLQKTPPGVVDMLSVKGIGPKKIALIWKELGIESVGELEYACQENRLVSVKGFGAKTQDTILQSIEFIKSNSGFCLYAAADGAMQVLLSFYENKFPHALIAPCGAFRQQQNFLSSLEWVTTLDETQILSAFEDAVYEKNYDDKGNLTIKTESLPPFVFYTAKDENDFYTILFKTSASAAFIIAFEEKYVYPTTIKNEQEIFSANNLAYIHPAYREEASALHLAAQNALPDLIMPNDIKGIIHSHSTYSDGQHSLEAMARAALEKGYEYLVISDHSQAAQYAGGLKLEEIAAQHKEIDTLNQQLAPFKIFKSIESDILNDGSLDYPEEILATFDLVIASVHSNLKMSEDKAMQRLLTAIQNPYTRILGHPTGRLLLSRPGYPIDHKTIIDACAEHKVVIEINAHPRRLDLDWSWIPYALEKGVRLSVNPDAHSIDGMDLVRYGVLSAQKGGLTKANNLSSFSLEEMERFVENKRQS